MPFQNWNVHHKCLNGPKTSLYLVRTYKYWAFALARPLSYISPPTGWCTAHVPCCLCKAHFLGDNCTVISRNSSFLCATGGERTGLGGGEGRVAHSGRGSSGFIKVPCTLDAPLLLCRRFNGENLPRKSINFAVTNQTSQISAWSARVELAPCWFYEPWLIVSSGTRE